MERGSGFHEWSYTKRPIEAGGKVFISVGNDGEVTAHIGYLTHEDAKKIQTILSGEDEADSKKTSMQKPEMSGPLKEYVTLHRHSAIRAACLTILMSLCASRWPICLSGRIGGRLMPNHEVS